MELPQTLTNKVFDIVEKGDEITVIVRDGEINEIKDDIDKFIYNDLNVYADKLVRFIEEEDIINKEVFKMMFDSVSLIDNSPLLSKFGLKRYVEIVYDLTNLDQTNKMLFNYALFGRGKTSGLIQSVNGKRIGKGVILIPYDAKGAVERFINGWNIRYSEREVLNFEWGLEDGNE
ncbi:MAG: hypothetical protein ACP5RE_01500 [Candidatus Acidifodinimicrobium sp.]